jgi:hypothetical protein
MNMQKGENIVVLDVYGGFWALGLEWNIALACCTFGICPMNSIFAWLQSV